MAIEGDELAEPGNPPGHELMISLHIVNCPLIAMSRGFPQAVSVGGQSSCAWMFVVNKCRNSKNSAPRDEKVMMVVLRVENIHKIEKMGPDAIEMRIITGI